VYAPHDLSGAEMAKWKKMRRKPRPKVDVLDQLALKPLEHYKVSGIMRRPKQKKHGKCHASCQEGGQVRMIWLTRHKQNFSIMSEYITEMGRIRHSSDTGLRPVNQRKMAKAVRRAMGMGLMPGVHRHPMLLQLEKKI
jgi:small subunit ribosomal protein S18